MSKDKWTEVKQEDSEVWNREKPIEGKLVAVKTNVGPNGSMMYQLKVGDETISVWGSTVLDTKFEQIKNGSQVRIEPQGLATSEKSGRQYQDFKVYFQPPEFEEIESGYEKAKATAKAIKGEDTEDIGDEPVDLSSIPF